MKVERRHELEQNALAAWLAALIVRIRPYQNAILGCVLLALLALVVYSWMHRQSEVQSAAAWSELFAAMPAGLQDPAALEKAAEAHPGTTTAHWAAVLAGEAYLAKACDSLFQSKADARDYLEKARDNFSRVLDEARAPAIRERATFGLARTDEAAGDLGKAIESWSAPGAKQSGQKADRGYQGVLNLWPNGAYAAGAEARLKDLQRPSTQKFCDDFAQWEPRRTASADGPGTPGLRPPTDLTLPDEPVFTPTDPLDPGARRPTGPVFPDLGTGGLKPAPEKPAKKPADKPAETPPAKTPEKPADSPSGGPAEKPAANP